MKLVIPITIPLHTDRIKMVGAVREITISG